MLSTIKKWLFKSQGDKAARFSPDGSELVNRKGGKPYFNRLYSYGYRGSGDEVVIYLIDPVERVRYPIVDERGNFVDFPGIENEYLLKPYYKGDAISSRIGFRTEFIRDEETGKLMVHWQVQPDGCYWADEGGYGAEDDLEIVLYAYLTEDGKFEAPFRIYKIGRTKYYGTDWEEQAKKEYGVRQEAERKRIDSRESVDDAMRRYIDTASSRFIEIASDSTKKFFVCFDIPASDYEAMLRLDGREPEWSLYIDVKVRGTDRLFSHIYTKRNDGGMHSRGWIIEELKRSATKEEIFNSIKHLCERLDKY